MGTSHRQAPVRDLVGRVRSGLGQLFSASRRLRDRRSAMAAPPPSGTRPRLGSCASVPCTWPTASSRRSSPRSTAGAPFLADPIMVEADPGDAPDPAADPAADVDRLGPQRDLDRRDGPRRTAAGADEALVLDRCHLGCRRPAGRRRPDRRLLLRSTEGLRRRRWPLAGAAQPGRDRADRTARRRPDRWQPGFLSLQTALDNSRKEQTYNTPALATLLLLADQVEWMLAGGGLDWCVQRTSASSGHLYGWAEARDFAAPFVADPAKRSLVVGTIDFDDSVDAAAVPRRCAPTASSTSSPTASWAATSCASACSRRSSRPTSKR